MTYICESCGFLFRRTAQVDACPFCGRSWLRPASPGEQERLEKKLAAEKKTVRRV